MTTHELPRGSAAPTPVPTVTRRMLAVAGLASALHAGHAGAAAPIPYQVYSNPQRVTSTVFEDLHYQHAATTADFGGKTWVAWNGNLRNRKEAAPGQVILLRASSDGGLHWGPLVTPFSQSYTALDDTTNQWVPMTGDADDDHRVPDQAALQWQPSLVAFKGRLLMFWGMDRHASDAALMMSVYEPASGNAGQGGGATDQWRSHELHFAPDGTPEFLADEGGVSPQTTDPSTLAIDSIGAYTRIAGAASLPTSVRLLDVPAALLAAENLGGPSRTATGTISLSGHHLLPAPGQASVLTKADGTQVLAVAVILEQTVVDWSSIAVKIPAVLTTTDLAHWQLSVVPMTGPTGDLLQSPRGDLGLVTAWEPTLALDVNGNVRLEFRINLAPLTAAGTPASSAGWRAGSAVGVIQPDGRISFSQAHHVDLDVPASRASMTKLPGQQRWVMAANHMVQGVAYQGSVAPSFPSDTYQPWAREDLSLWFSTRGGDDYVSGIDMSAPLGVPGLELVHYPAVQAVGNALAVAYSLRRRDATCGTPAATLAGCHDAIQYVRIGSLPDAAKPAVYPNAFASYFTYGHAAAQPRSSTLAPGVLTLNGRGSAGIETPGTTGCVSLRFRLEAPLAAGDVRPVFSFGRSPDRAHAMGLQLRGMAGGKMDLLLGSVVVQTRLAPGSWISAPMCYDFVQHKLWSGTAVWNFGAATPSYRSYLGDDTLAWRALPMPDLSFDLAALALQQ